MPEYLDFQIETDPETIAQLGFDEMAARIPGWDPIVGEIDTALIQAAARIASQVRASAGVVPIGVFRYLADQFGLVPRTGTPWQVICTINWDDALNHTIPAGTVWAVTVGVGDVRSFTNAYDIVESDGDATNNNVLLISSDLAQDNSDVLVGSTVATTGTLDGNPDGIVTVEAYGGQQSETDDEFFQRLIRRFALNTAAPILPGDFAALALDVAPIGSRAIAIDGYDAVALTSGNARTVTIVCIDQTGAPLSATMKSDILAYVASKREINWNVYVIDPVFFTVSVKWTAHAIPGFATATVNAAIVAAVNAYLSGARWGLPSIETYSNWTQLEGWDKVRLGELYELINAVDGVAYVDTLNLVAGGSAPTSQVADVSLTGGIVIVPAAGSVAGSVS
jgi:hypothetical protein